MDRQAGDVVLTSVQLLEIYRHLGSVHAHVEPAQEDLAKREGRLVEIAGRHQLLDDFSGNGLAGLVITGKERQHVRLPAPMLHDL